MKIARDLPVHSFEREILGGVVNNQAVVIIAETGSGKTTQVPAMLYQNLGLKVCVTEPRRLAATSVATHVSETIFEESVGGKCGYVIRYDQSANHDSKIVYMTEGILLQALKSDPLLRRYDAVMVDEAHERSVNIDVIMGFLKGVMQKRPEFRVIIASATIDAGMFSEYFGNCPVINIPGRTHPVDIMYVPDFAWNIGGAVKALPEFLAGVPDHGGDMLVFLPGAEDISTVARGLEDLKLPDIEVIQVFGAQNPDEQRRIYATFPGKRKIILATNIAETSITIPGVTVVVDPGYVKQTDLDPFTGMETLHTTDHSQSGCNQRAGRAGRIQPGVCYRLFSEENFNARPKFTKPEVQRMALENFVLLMISLGIDAKEFDFITPPDTKQIDRAIEVLKGFEALDQKGQLTETGKLMLKFPLDVRLSKLNIEGDKAGCVSQAVTVAAFLSVQGVFVRPREKEMEADAARAKFRDYTNREDSDILVFLRVWEAYKQSGYSKSWCIENFINWKRMHEIGDIRDQIFRVNKHVGIGYSKAEKPEIMNYIFARTFVRSIARHTGQGNFSGALDSMLFYKVFRGSVLCRVVGIGEYVVATQIITTRETLARVCVRVKPEWLPEFMPGTFTIDPMRLTKPADAVGKVRAKVTVKERSLERSSTEVEIDEKRAREIQRYWLEQPGAFVTWVAKPERSIDYFTDEGHPVSFLKMLGFSGTSHPIIGRVYGGYFIPECLMLFVGDVRNDAPVESDITESQLEKLRARFAK